MSWPGDNPGSPKIFTNYILQDTSEQRDVFLGDIDLTPIQVVFFFLIFIYLW